MDLPVITSEVDGPAELPAYSVLDGSTSHEPRARRRTEHIYLLNDRKDNPWATLTLYSGARSSQQVPTFVDDEPIEGSLSLSINKKDSIKSVTMTIQGKIIAGTEGVEHLPVNESYLFLKNSYVLWTQTTNNLPTPFPLQEEIRRGDNLIGQHFWPFSFTLPREVTVSPTSSEPPQTYRLPQTLFTTVTIQYELVLEFARGFMRSNSKIHTSFAYIPCTTPQSASMLRQLAYRDGTQLVPPTGDPEGWKTLPPATLRGKIFATRQIDVQYTLSLATPLSYTRGTVIPLFLAMSSSDAQGLSLLASNKNINVALCCHVRYHMFPSHAKKSSQTGAGWKEVSELLESAVWWPADDSTPGYLRKQMHGEIRLTHDLMPSTSIAHLTVKYLIVVLPFKAPGFAPLGVTDEPLISEVVEVTTSLGPGPEPTAYAPPGYDYGKRQPRTSNITAHYGVE